MEAFGVPSPSRTWSAFGLSKYRSLGRILLEARAFSFQAEEMPTPSSSGDRPDSRTAHEDKMGPLKGRAWRCINLQARGGLCRRSECLR